MEENTNIPQHIAIIMDGNGRWAKLKNKRRNEGHRKGGETLEKITDYANQLGVKYLTVYAFSTENWNRPQEEVDGLMKLLKRSIEQYYRRAKKDNIRFLFIGDRTRLSKDIQESMKALEDFTASKDGLCLIIALNYGGRDEIIRGCKKLIKDIQEHKLSLEDISEECFASYLDTKGIPDPDLMIRTSGELRTSNYLPWQLAYSEFYFTDCLWPDFTPMHLDEALKTYQMRKRRFGKTE
jgi:undecaprenyl diphosphate synthase